jgi:hypothetical protein
LRRFSKLLVNLILPFDLAVKRANTFEAATLTSEQKLTELRRDVRNVTVLLASRLEVPPSGAGTY